jgi:hypothetical protein
MSARDELELKIQDVLEGHRIECTGLGEVSCGGCRDKGWMSSYQYDRHLSVLIADLVLKPVNVTPHQDNPTPSGEG